MAFSAKQIFLLFLLTLFFAKNIHARDHQFFSKTPRIHTTQHPKTLEEEAKEIERKVYDEAGRDEVPQVFPDNEFANSDQKFVDPFYDQGAGRNNGPADFEVGKSDENYASLMGDKVINGGDRDKATIIPDMDRSDLPYNDGVAFKVDSSLDKALGNGVRDKITPGTPDIYRAYLPYDNGDDVDLKKFNTATSYVSRDQAKGNFGNSARVYRDKMINRDIDGDEDDTDFEDAKALVEQGNRKFNYDKELEKNRVDLNGKNTRVEYKDYRRSGGYHGISQGNNNQFDGYNNNRAQFDEDFKFDNGGF